MIQTQDHCSTSPLPLEVFLPAFFIPLCHSSTHRNTLVTRDLLRIQNGHQQPMNRTLTHQRGNKIFAPKNTSNIIPLDAYIPMQNINMNSQDNMPLSETSNPVALNPGKCNLAETQSKDFKMRLWICSRTLKRPFTPPLQFPSLILSPVADHQPVPASNICLHFLWVLKILSADHPSSLTLPLCSGCQYREVRSTWAPTGPTSLEIRCTVFTVLPVLHFKFLSLSTSSCSRPLAGALLTLLP